MERDVKHGCCSCTYYRTRSMKQEPCRGCKRWSHWEDKDRPAAADGVGAGTGEDRHTARSHS